MNFIEFESAQKLRGGFYTHPDIAAFLVDWVKTSSPASVLEPSCGDGCFIEQLRRARIRGLEKVVACEIDPEESSKAAMLAWPKAHVLNTDFLRWYLDSRLEGLRFDAVVGNPPFIRYQYLPETQQALSQQIFEDLGLPFTKHTNAWVPFVLASLELLQPGGRLGMVVPSEILHIPHAQSLRKYLAAECSRALLLDPEQIWFSDTLQGTVLLLAEKKRSGKARSYGVGVTAIRNRDCLMKPADDYFRQASYANGATIQGKWMAVFLSEEERALLRALRESENIREFSSVAAVDVGIVTGANKFFLVSDATVERYCLRRWSHPMFGRSEHVKGLIYSKQDHMANKTAGLPTNFLWFQDDEEWRPPETVQAYLRLGVSDSLHKRYKCRIRKPWYRVPSVYLAPVAMLKRAHDYPRLVLNQAEAYTTDTAYRIRPLALSARGLVNSFVNSLTCVSAELNGRHYGGGVLELVPSEIERLLVPTLEASAALLRSTDKRFRESSDNAEFLRENDRMVLSEIGLTSSEQARLHEAWLRLRNRRQRKSSGANDRPSGEPHPNG